MSHHRSPDLVHPDGPGHLQTVHQVRVQGGLLCDGGETKSLNISKKQRKGSTLVKLSDLTHGGPAKVMTSGLIVLI